MTLEPRLSNSAENPRMTNRDDRLAELDRLIADLDAQRRPLVAERSELHQQQARGQWPDGPFTLHYWRYHAELTSEHDEPLAALRHGDYIEGEGSGSTVKVTDRHGTVIYDMSGYPYKRVAEGYPEIPDDL